MFDGSRDRLQDSLPVCHDVVIVEAQNVRAPSPTLPRKRGRERTEFAAWRVFRCPTSRVPYRFGAKSWLGNAAAESGALITTKE